MKYESLDWSKYWQNKKKCKEKNLLLLYRNKLYELPSMSAVIKHCWIKVIVNLIWFILVSDTWDINIFIFHTCCWMCVLRRLIWGKNLEVDCHLKCKNENRSIFHTDKPCTGLCLVTYGDILNYFYYHGYFMACTSVLVSLKIHRLIIRMRICEFDEIIYTKKASANKNAIDRFAFQTPHYLIYVKDYADAKFGCVPVAQPKTCHYRPRELPGSWH